MDLNDVVMEGPLTKNERTSCQPYYNKTASKRLLKEQKTKDKINDDSDDFLITGIAIGSAIFGMED